VAPEHPFPLPRGRYLLQVVQAVAAILNHHPSEPLGPAEEVPLRFQMLSLAPLVPRVPLAKNCLAYHTRLAACLPVEQSVKRHPFQAGSVPAGCQYHLHMVLEEEQCWSCHMVRAEKCSLPWEP